MPENTSKPQELAGVCAQTCPSGLGGEMEQIQSSPPLTPGWHTDGRHVLSSSKCWETDDVFEKGRGYNRKMKSHLEAVVQLPPFQAGSTHFSHEVAWSVVIAEHSGGIETLGSHQVTMEDRMAVGVQRAIPQHK